MHFSSSAWLRAACLSNFQCPLSNTGHFHSGQSMPQTFSLDLIWDIFGATWTQAYTNLIVREVTRVHPLWFSHPPCELEDSSSAQFSCGLENKVTGVEGTTAACACTVPQLTLSISCLNRDLACWYSTTKCLLLVAVCSLRHMEMFQFLRFLTPASIEEEKLKAWSGHI